jgi:hypothetical protein
MCGFSQSKKGRMNRDVYCGAPKEVDAPNTTSIQTSTGSQYLKKRAGTVEKNNAGPSNASKIGGRTPAQVKRLRSQSHGTSVNPMA